MCTTKRELQSLISKYRKLQSEKSEIEQNIKDIQEQIFEYLDSHGIEPKQKIHGPNYILSYAVISRSNFDKELLMQVLGSDLTPYQSFSEYKRLYIR